MADKKNEGPKPTKLPAEIVGPSFESKRLIDGDGKIWNLKTKKRNHWWGEKKHLEIVTDPDSLDVFLARSLDKEADEALKQWVADADKTLEDFSVNTESLLQTFLGEAFKKFRKEFVEKVSAGGAGAFREALEKRFEEIGKVWAEKYLESQEIVKAAAMRCSGPFLAGTRFLWEAQTTNHRYQMFCIEFAPQRRVINIWKESRYLAFPWQVFLVLFRDGKLYCLRKGGGAHHGFWMFYRSLPLKTAEDNLCWSNLPHIWKDWPHNFCLGYDDMPIVQLTDPDCFTKLFEWFWGSEFIGHNLTHFYEQTRKQNKDLESTESWERITKSNPEKMLEMNWIPCEYDLQSFARRAMETIIKDDKEQRLSDTSNQDWSGVKKKQVDQVREELEEQIFFLSDHFTVPVGDQKKIRAAVDESFADAKIKTAASLKDSCENLAKSASKSYLGDLAKHNEPKP
ncbi:MAG: hypothetical protein G01um101419_614 [Parcubacteria group bacterium Gr01-1014_19]|nr:MAG: hypothetical protein G01um101419_614 [Parcubacteria group bacterium Gr01-1014_19]